MPPSAAAHELFRGFSFIALTIFEEEDDHGLLSEGLDPNKECNAFHPPVINEEAIPPSVFDDSKVIL